MNVWGWIAVYAVGLTLLQLLVYRYLLNNGGSLTRRVGTPFGENERDGPYSSTSSNSSESPGPDGRSQPPHSARVPNDGDDRDPTDTRVLDMYPVTPDDAGREMATAPDGTEGRRCPHCGTTNELDQAFTHCWNCTRKL